MKRSLVLPLMAAALALVACQQPPNGGAKPVALDQAKDQSVEIQGSVKFVPPPRTIDDILPLLENIRPPEAEIAKRRAIVDAEPGSNLKGDELAKFYRRRALARRDNGRLAEAAADADKAVATAGEQPALQYERALYLKTLADIDGARGHFRGQLKAALAREAIIFRTRRGVESQSAWVILSPAVAMLNLGDLKGATERLERAKDVYHACSGCSAFTLADWRRGLEQVEGEIERDSGNYSASENAFREALTAASEEVRLFPEAKARGQADPDLALADTGTFRESERLNLAWVLALEGKLSEAEATAREALVNHLGIKGADATVRSLEVLSSILSEEDRASEAEKLEKLAIAMKLKSGLVPSDWTVVSGRVSVATDEVHSLRWQEALENYESVAADLANDTEGRQRFLDHNTAYAIALLYGGQIDKALVTLDRAVAQAETTLGKENRSTAERRAWRAVAYEHLGRHEDALSDFRVVLPLLTAARLPPGASEQARVLKVFLESYLHLLSEIRGTPLEGRVGDVAGEAFRIADLARGQVVQQAVANAVARLHIVDPALADLARREQDAGQNITALEGTLVNVVASPESQRDPDAIARLRQNIADLRQDQDRLRAEIQNRFPDYAALIDPKPPTMAQVQATLHPGEAFVSTYSLDDRTLIWAIPKTGASVFASSVAKRTDLTAAAAILHDALDPQATTLAEIPPFDVGAAHKLYVALLEPAVAGWKDAKSLVIASDWLDRVPAGLLVTQPVSQPEDKQGEALFSGYRSVPFLVRQVSVAQVPSAATLVTLRSLSQGAAARQAFVGFGDPVFTAQQAAQEKADLANATTVAPQQMAMTETRGIKLRAAPKVDKLSHADLSMVPRLPDTAQELREVATTLKADPATDLFLGPAANEHQVETMKLDDRRVVMFATHGLVPGDLDGLTQPALALSTPALSGTDGDGLLTMDKIMGLKLDADWVVLSACNTSAGEERGAEAVSGLGRAFFYAGARAVLVTNWPVETESARFLTTAAFRHQSQEPGINRAEALRQSELDLIGSDYRGNDGKPIFSYAHPLFWAPFTLVGDEG